jgi:hypothetical protein
MMKTLVGTSSTLSWLIPLARHREKDWRRIIMGHPAEQAGYTALLMMDIIVTIAQGRGWVPFLEPHTVPKDYEGRCCGCNLINSELFPAAA